MADNRSAISAIESGGRYDLTGPVTRNGDRAYGRYQVMGRNVPEWTRAALGRAMTPQEFLKDQKAQDATFDHRFGMYAAKYGPEKAARAWFAGEGGMNDDNRKDMLGTSVANYGKRFMQGLGKTASAQQPTASASAFDQYPQMDAQEMARNSGGYNASGKNASKSKEQTPSYEASLINDVMQQEGAKGGNADPWSNAKLAGYIPKKTPKTDIPFRGEGAGEATHPSQGTEVGQRAPVGEDVAGATGPGQTGMPWVDAGSKEIAPPIGNKGGKPTPRERTPYTEDDLMRQIEEASGIDRNGNPTFPQRDPTAQPQQSAQPQQGGNPGSNAVSMAGGMGAIALGGAQGGAPPIASVGDPVAAEVQKNVQASPSAAPAWLDMAMKEFAPNVAKTVATDPQAAQAAQVLSQKVVANQAGADSQKYGPGQSSPLLQQMMQQVQQAMPGGGTGGQPQQPMNTPVDYYNRGGGVANQGWSGGYYE